MTFNFLFDVAYLVIYGLVFGFNKLLKVFGFLGFYFVGLGWFVVCVNVDFFFW
jgi:hypothetical protein